MRQQVLKSIEKISKKNKKIIFLGSDLGPGILKDFKKKKSSKVLHGGCS